MKENVCQYPYGPSREEYGAFGLQSVSPVCNGASLGKGIRTLHTEGTMRIGYPELLQGGQPAIFTAEADGSMTWELVDTTKTGSAWLELAQSVTGLPGLCKYAEYRRQDGGATGSAALRIDRQTCTYDPAAAFSGKNEVQIVFSFASLAGRVQSWSMDGANGAVKLTYKRCTDPNNCKPPEIRRPVLIVPGILGSYYYATADHQYLGPQPGRAPGPGGHRSADACLRRPDSDAEKRRLCGGQGPLYRGL